MDVNGLNIGKELAMAVIALTLFGVLYNLGIERVPWLAQRRSAEQVVLGVLVTVLASGMVIGWHHVPVMLILFGASGFPMLIGSWIRAAQDEAKAKQALLESLQHDES